MSKLFPSEHNIKTGRNILRQSTCTPKAKPLLLLPLMQIVIRTSAFPKLFFPPRYVFLRILLCRKQSVFLNLKHAAYRSFTDQQ